MAITLNPGFSGYISVESESTECFKKEIHSFEEAKDFIDKYGQSVSGGTLLRATLIPLRTDCWADFAKDLFLPTFVNYAIKVDNLALRILASLPAIVLDVITLVPRSIIAPFRVMHNHKHKTEHPLVELIGQKYDPLKSSGVVKICVKFEKVDIKAGDAVRSADQLTIDGHVMVAIKRLPGMKAELVFNERVAKYIEIDGEWDLQSSEKGTSAHMRAAF